MDHLGCFVEIHLLYNTIELTSHNNMPYLWSKPLLIESVETVLLLGRADTRDDVRTYGPAVVG